MSLTSTPPTLTLPASTSQNLSRRLVSVLLPDPDSPTSAVIVCSGTVNVASGNSKESLP